MPTVPTRDQISAGGVVCRKDGETLEVVLIAVGEPLRWQLPKGQIEPDEAPEAAALREVREETGITARLLEPIAKIEYWYYNQRRGERIRYHKAVHFFLMEYQSGSTADHDHEVHEARWVEIGEAERMLAFKNEQGLISKARIIVRVGPS
jgi:8-oxo-dGTP pyrophosphatase MutT (NUDIX family)